MHRPMSSNLRGDHLLIFELYSVYRVPGVPHVVSIVLQGVDMGFAGIRRTHYLGGMYRPRPDPLLSCRRCL